MDKTALVKKSDLEIQGLIMEALNRAKIPITFCDWNYVEQLDEWQLVIATPWHDTMGPHEAYSRVIRAFQEAKIYEEVPMRRVFLRSPEDPLVKSLQKDASERKEGSIHILEHNGRGHKVYTLIFAPYSGPGGAVPAVRFSALHDLSEFLDRRLHIGRSSIDEAMSELTRRGSASIFNVLLTTREAKRLGLA